MPVFRSSRKVQVFGSSLALTLPALFVKANEVKKGSVVNVLFDFDGVLVMYNCSDVNRLKECLLEIKNNIEKDVNTN